MDIKPIPAFYCCYLLRSTVKHTQLYVGSTPNPKRRLDQHNGIAKGGASRTGSRNGAWRPWEMSLIVTGFPSNIAALQFEWAWQNTHLTRKISKEERISIPITAPKWSKKQGKYINRPKRLPVKLKDKLINLHLLLRVPGFNRWPLQLQFFHEDVYQSWRTWTDGSLQPIRDSITIVKDFEIEQGPSNIASNRQVKIDTLDVSYSSLKSHLEKSMLLKQASSLSCSCCTKKVDMSVENILVCKHERCYAVSHLACLASSFLGPEPDTLVPIEGTCPKCQANTKWVDLVKEMSLRTRNEKEVVRLLKPKRRRGKMDSSQTKTTQNGDEDEEEEFALEDIIDEPSIHETKNWESSSIASEDEARSEAQSDIEQPSYSDSKQELSIVIEDSEDSADWYMLD